MLKGKLDSLEAQYASMASELKPDYPPMRELHTKIDRTRALLNGEIESVASDVRAQYAAASSKEQDLQQELEREKNFALGLNDAAVRYTILQREADTNRALYNAVLKRLKDVSLVADVHASRISIVDRAVPPLVASSPNKRKDMLTAGLVGLAGGIALCFLLDYLDNRLKTPAEAQRYLRLPVLAMVPASKSVNGRRVSESSPLRIGARTSGSGSQIVPSYGGYSAMGEAYRDLCATLLLSRAGSPPKTIVITSAEPTEGKTVTAVNTAITFARRSSKVLLIDADLRRPACHKLLSVKNHFGLSEVLAGATKLTEGAAHGPSVTVRATSIEGMFFLSSGKVPPNPSELLGSEMMKNTLKYFAEQYDYVVIDTSPVLRVSDALFLGAIADGAVVVIDSSATPKQHVREAVTRLTQARVKVLGVLFNKVKASGFGYSYHYGSYRYGPYRYATEPYPSAEDSADEDGAEASGSEQSG